MSLVRLAVVSALAWAVLPPPAGAAQTFPITPGTLEFQVGVAGIVLPEDTDGMFSAQPQIRAGLFLREGVELQGEADARVWPLGPIAAHSYQVTGNLLWFPRLSDHHELYLLGGGGGAFSNPPGPEGGSFDPLLRGGLGVKIPLVALTEAFRALYLTAEYRGELVFATNTSFVSGVALGFSRFR
jgi:hypothetical protein